LGTIIAHRCGGIVEEGCRKCNKTPDGSIEKNQIHHGGTEGTEILEVSLREAVSLASAAGPL
jgi:hypothetical protein